MAVAHPVLVAGFLGVFSLLLHGDAPLMSPAVVDGTGNPVELNYDQDERGYVAIVSVGLTMVAVAVCEHSEQSAFHFRG